MKKILLVLLILGFHISSANNQDELNAKRLEWSKADLAKRGLPVPDGGIRVMPEKEMSSYNEMKEVREKAKKDIKTLGYIKTSSPSTELLLHLKITAKHDLLNHQNDSNPYSTHLKKNINELKMAYDPTIVPSSVADSYIGAAPYLTFLKDQGWVGVIQFFTNKNIGNCSFSENNVKLSHGAINIAKEDVRDDINGKITTVEIMGTPNEGFTYAVEWFDNSFFRTIECANKRYSPDLTNIVINLAKSIDSSSNS